MHARRPEQVPELERRLHRWTREGLISGESAARIWALEREAPTVAPRSTARVRPARRIPVITEAIGYLGAALAAAAGAVFLGRTWDSLSQAGRLLVPGIGCVVFLGAGFAIHRSLEPAVQRLAGLLWLLAVGGAAGTAAILAAEVADVSDRATTVAVGATVTVLAGCLYAYRRWPLPQLALLVGLAVLVGGAFFEQVLTIGVSLTVLGFAWAALGVLRVLEPTTAATIVGGLLMLFGPTMLMGDHPGIGLPLGVVAAASLVGLGALMRQGVTIGIGVIGAFLYLVATIDHFLEGASTAVGFLVVGVGLMVAAVLAMRARPRPGPPRPAHG